MNYYIYLRLYYIEDESDIKKKDIILIRILLLSTEDSIITEELRTKVMLKKKYIILIRILLLSTEDSKKERQYTEDESDIYKMKT